MKAQLDEIEKVRYLRNDEFGFLTALLSNLPSSLREP